MKDYLNLVTKMELELYTFKTVAIILEVSKKIIFKEVETLLKKIKKSLWEFGNKIN